MFFLFSLLLWKIHEDVVCYFSLKGFGLNGVSYFLFESCLQHYVLHGY